VLQNRNIIFIGLRAVSSSFSFYGVFSSIYSADPAARLSVKDTINIKKKHAFGAVSILP
jgi:hypothetical protein